jgi:hypothetical protein
MSWEFGCRAGPRIRRFDARTPEDAQVRSDSQSLVNLERRSLFHERDSYLRLPRWRHAGEKLSDTPPAYPTTTKNFAASSSFIATRAARASPKGADIARATMLLATF